MARGSGAQDAAAGAHAVIAGAQAYKHSQDSDRDYDYKKQEDQRKANRQAIQDEINKRMIDSQLRGQELHQKLLGAQISNDFPFLDSRPDDPKGNNIPTALAVPNTEAQKMGSINDSRIAAGFDPVSSMDEFLPQRDVAAYKLSQDTGQAKLADIQAHTGAEQSKTGFYDRGGKAAAPSKISGPVGDILEGVRQIRSMNKQADQLLASDDPDDREEGQSMKMAAGISQSHFMAQLSADQKPKKAGFKVTHDSDGNPLITGESQSIEDAMQLADAIQARKVSQAQLPDALKKAAQADADAAQDPTGHPWYQLGMGSNYQQKSEAAHKAVSALQKYGRLPNADAVEETATPAAVTAAVTPAPSASPHASSFLDRFALPGVKGVETPSSKLNAPAPEINSQKEFDKLPSGSVYIENGKKFKKP